MPGPLSPLALLLALAAARRQTLELLAFYRRTGDRRRQFWEYRVLASMA